MTTYRRVAVRPCSSTIAEPSPRLLAGEQDPAGVDRLSDAGAPAAACSATSGRYGCVLAHELCRALRALGRRTGDRRPRRSPASRRGCARRSGVRSPRAASGPRCRLSPAWALQLRQPRVGVVRGAGLHLLHDHRHGHGALYRERVKCGVGLVVFGHARGYVDLPTGAKRALASPEPIASASLPITASEASALPLPPHRCGRASACARAAGPPSASSWAIMPPIEMPSTWASFELQRGEQRYGILGHLARVTGPSAAC